MASLEDSNKLADDIIPMQKKRKRSSGDGARTAKDDTPLSKAQVFLDEKHDELEYMHANDNNDYTLGRIGSHNVVIAVLPDGEYGVSSATGAAKDMLHSFPNVKIGLMVGIGGGAPSQKHDIRLGDVVVSAPRNGPGGVFQYDFGKAIQGGSFHTTGFLNQPPRLLRTAVNGLEAHYEINGHQLEESISGILDKRPRLRRKYGRPMPITDILYKPTVIHPLNSEERCTGCCGTGVSNLISRPDRTENEDAVTIHYGLIASANQMMRDALIRDRLSKEKDVLCFEMEAAGLMNQFPCLVIRGICDYSDSHKNKQWQGYAAMTAAAYARDLLYRIPLHKVEAEKKINDILSGVQKCIDELLSAHHNKEHQGILEWLSPIDYASQQKDYISLRQPGTGTWFLGSQEYQTWLMSDKQTLFCPGDPGAGKTIMAATVIDDLLHTRHKDEAGIGISYLYCDFRRQYEQKAEDLLANLIKQLAQKQVTIPECVKALHEKYRSNTKRPSLNELSNALQSISILYSKIFIIVDALDECQVTNGCRNHFLSKIFKLQAAANASIFATARPIPEIVKSFNQSASLKISAKYEDVQTYLAGHMATLPSFVLENADLQNEIKATIPKISDGMFLLVRLQVDSLAQLPTVGHIKQALRNLPRSLGKTYEQAMERIESQGEKVQQLAKRVISWLLYAKRVLSITELQHAVAVEPGAPELDEEFIPDKEIMVSICAGLVTIDTESSVIRLAHYTIQEYFEQEGKAWFGDAEAYITAVCVTYLSFHVFESGICGSEYLIYTEGEKTEEIYERLRLYPLYTYAAKNWGYHAHAAPTMQLILDFLRNEGKVSAASQGMTHDGYVKIMESIHLAAYFGLDDLITYLLENGHDIEAEDSYQRTALFVASEFGNESAIKLLLSYGATLDTYSEYGAPITEAAYHGNEGIVRLLLEHGADVNAVADFDGSVLGIAACAGYESIAMLALEHGIDIDLTDAFEATPLQRAAERGHDSIVKLLLEHGANIDSNAYGLTPLKLAIKEGSEGIIKLLLENGASTNEKGS